MSTAAEKVEGAATRALIRLLLETHSQKDVLALLQCSVSGREVSHGQVRRQRRNQLAAGATRRRKNVSLMHLRDQTVEAVVIEPAPVAAAPAPIVRRPPAPPESFESQLARIAAGARIMAAPDFRTCAPSYTLGGVASGML